MQRRTQMHVIAAGSTGRGRENKLSSPDNQPGGKKGGSSGKERRHKGNQKNGGELFLSMRLEIPTVKTICRPNRAIAEFAGVSTRPACDIELHIGPVTLSRINIRILRRIAMSAQTASELAAKKCVPCEGGVPKLSLEATLSQLAKLSGWTLSHDGERIRKNWIVKNFMTGIDFFNRVAELAEEEGHHPDLHLEGYRNVSIEIWTHAIGGLSENDFILAAKIDRLPVKLKTT